MPKSDITKKYFSHIWSLKNITDSFQTFTIKFHRVSHCWYLISAKCTMLILN